DTLWTSKPQDLVNLFCIYMPTENRLKIGDSASSIAVLDQAPQHPIHVLYADDRVELRISSYFRRAFGKDLIVFRGGGTEIPLFVGDRPKPQEGKDRISETYLQRVRESSPPLKREGDGMRSFASVILMMLTSSPRWVLLLEEPEAFLPPPQA